MEKNILEQTLKYAVRLKIGNSVSSGVPFVPGDGFFYVFTCLHCLDGLLSEDRDSIRIELGYHDGKNIRLWRIAYDDIEFLCFAGEKPTVISEADEKYKGSERDYAVLRIKIEEAPFHKEGNEDIIFPILRIWPMKNKLKKGEYLYGAGYPNGVNEPRDLTSDFHLENNNQYVVHSTITHDHTFVGMMHGFSGCAQFCLDNSFGLRLIGLTTCSKSNEHHEYFNLVKLYDLLDIMKNHSWPIPETGFGIPKSFKEKMIEEKLMDDLVNISESEVRNSIYLKYKEYGNKITPDSYLEESSINEVKECSDTRLSCPDFWYGTFWISLLSETLSNSEFSDLCMEYICSEGFGKDKIASIVHELIVQELVLEKIKDGSILLWQSREIPRIRVGKKSKISNILGNFIDDHLYELERGEDLIRGNVKDHRYVLIHRSELLQAISDCENWEEAENEMRGVISNVWR